MSLTQPMKRAVIRLHGSPKTASEAKMDKRTKDALAKLELIRGYGQGRRVLWSLTPKGIEVYNNTTLEEAGL